MRHPEQSHSFSQMPEAGAFNREPKPEQTGSPEQREAIEEAKESRMRLLKEAIASRLRETAQSPLLNKLVNILPVVGDVAMFAKILRGKEGEKTLSVSEKTIYTLIVTSSIAATAMLASGELGASAGLKALGDALLHLDSLPTYLQSAAERAQEINPRLSAILFAAANFAIAKKTEMYGLKYLFDTNLTVLNLKDEI